MPGGTYRRTSASFHGSPAESAFSHFSFDTLFIGADGVDMTAGVTTFNEVFAVSRAMCRAAKNRTACRFIQIWPPQSERGVQP